GVDDMKLVPCVGGVIDGLAVRGRGEGAVADQGQSLQQPHRLQVVDDDLAEELAEKHLAVGHDRLAGPAGEGAEQAPGVAVDDDEGTALETTHEEAVLMDQELARWALDRDRLSGEPGRRRWCRGGGDTAGEENGRQGVASHRGPPAGDVEGKTPNPAAA